MTRPPAAPFPDSLDELGRTGDAGALAHYSDPAYYTKTYGARRHDVSYYVRLARDSGGPVLEYGVGNGRVALAVAQAGIEVEGVDLSRAMLDDLAAALEKRPAQVRERVRFHHADMRTFASERRFPLVIVPFNGILHLYELPDLEAFLGRVRAHLAPGGRFVFDFSLPQPGDLSRDPERWYGAPRIRHPTTGELVRYDERFEYDPIRQLLLVTTRFSPEAGDPWTIPLTHRQLYPREVEALLHYNGFSDLRFSADFGDQPADAATDSLVVSAAVAGPTR
ncbi:MAG TPA: class I SAM-dependent methyltransferase [Polyangiaceae bacterium]